MKTFNKNKNMIMYSFRKTLESKLTTNHLKLEAMRYVTTASPIEHSLIKTKIIMIVAIQ